MRYCCGVVLVGAHVSSAGGASQAFGRALVIGAEAIQIFLAAPQRWKAPTLDETAKEAFREQAKATGLPAYAHAIYLVNLASSDSDLVTKSIASLRAHLALCGELGIEGLVFHLGSHMGVGFEDMLPQLAESVREVVEDTPGNARLIIENSAGQGGCVGTTFREIGAIIDAAGRSPRIGVCLDTCHALATGYDLTSAGGVEQAVGELGREVGLNRLSVVHANDSKAPLGSMRDRHENIGDGHIGLDGFAAIVNHSAFRDTPLILEVPGLAGRGPDVENVTRLKSIRESFAKKVRR